MRVSEESAKAAVLFLMHARAAWLAVVLRMWAYARGGNTTCRRRVDDADDTRQCSLHERGDEDPATKQCRNGSDH
ncbi:MAG TPA: hypothetical protein VK494_07220 [Gemmatimonadaceae bacterium]|nr:hypothetical protein [Gemmatimonadaceae bacterium]